MNRAKAMTMIRHGANRIHALLTPPIVGYDNKAIADTVKRKTAAKIEDGEFNLGDFARILGAIKSIERSPVRVIDFGGACGGYYFAISKLGDNPPLRWAVIETKSMVAAAQSFVGETLNFFTTVEEATAWLGGVDVIHSAGTLQYLDDQTRAIQSIVGAGAECIVWDRTILSDAGLDQSSELHMMDDHGPSGTEVYVLNVPVRVAVRKYPKADFIAAHDGYDLTEQCETAFTFRRCQCR